MLFYYVEQSELSVIHEDNQIIVVIKSQGMPTQADASGDLDLLTNVKDYLGGKFVGLVHRLDRVTGGVMVFAKTSKAASRLAEQMQNNGFEKTYHAIVQGAPKKREETLVNYLLKNEAKNTVQVVPSATKGAKRAELEYRMLESKDEQSLLQVKLLTGRGHQIRVQLANIGHPIVGDHKYGAGAQKELALWAHELCFTHPTTEEFLKFIVNPPEDGAWANFEYDRTVRKAGAK